MSELVHELAAAEARVTALEDAYHAMVEERDRAHARIYELNRISTELAKRLAEAKDA